MDKIIKISAGLFAVIVIASLAVFLAGPHQAPPATPAIIYYFYGEECPHCHNIKPFMDNITQKYPEANIQVLEVWHNQTNQQIYTRANAAAGRSPPGVPEIVLGKTVLVGEKDIPDKREALVQDYLKKKQYILRPRHPHHRGIAPRTPRFQMSPSVQYISMATGVSTANG
jgi:thiol-disulfide isomerase/thioredoxin